ncbi:MAG: spore germination protein [Firmicutes bacterium]|nr:spore germination protein [Bacillota bacterium]MCL5057478.1 spore germination protein [Actinomycetota bacterium]
MSRLVKKYMRKRNRGKKDSPKENEKAGNRQAYEMEELEKMPVSDRLAENLDILKGVLGHNSDVVFRTFRIGLADRAEAVVVYVDGMIEKKIISAEIIKPLMLESRMAGMDCQKEQLLDLVENSGITASEVKSTAFMGDVIAGVLYGDAALLIDGLGTGLAIDVKGWQTRSIEEPPSEVLVRGPREGFTETLRTNITLIRRKLRSPDLFFRDIQVGRKTNTSVTIAYINGLADSSLVAEVISRISRIDIDGILESSYLEEFIEDSPYSPFPQILHTERPDKVAAALLEGRVAILTDGTPVALVAPAPFITFMQSPEDYYERYFLSTAIRWVRYTAFVISLVLPSLYIAITTFHQEMIPTRLLISLAAAREGVPFPALVEALLMEFTFEALREAGIRLPRAVGQAVSIVGALVIGQAAIQANIVSPLMVIVVAVTGIASFMNPAFNIALTMRLLRFPMMLLAGTLGLFGVMTGILAILIHLAGLRSFGVPYMDSISPFHPGDMKDVAIRAPWWAMDRRPADISSKNRRRQSSGLKPAPPDPGGNKG